MNTHTCQFLRGNKDLPFSRHIVAHNRSVVTSNVDLVDDSYVCDDVWPVC